VFGCIAVACLGIPPAQTMQHSLAEPSAMPRLLVLHCIQHPLPYHMLLRVIHCMPAAHASACLQQPMQPPDNRLPAAALPAADYILLLVCWGTAASLCDYTSAKLVR
jgi:hypothetical protein